MVPECLFIFVIFYVLFLRWSRRRKIECLKQFGNGLFSMPGIGHAHMFIGNGEVKMKSIEALGREAWKQDGVTKVHSWIFDKFYIMVGDPVTAEAVLRNCLEKDDAMKLFTSLFGEAILISPVSEWRHRRKILNPAFTSKNLNQFVDVFRNNGAILAEKLQKIAESGAFSIYDHLTAYSLDSVFETIYGYEIGAQQNPQHPVMQAFTASCELVSNRMCLPWLHNDTVYQMTSQYTMIKKNAELIFKFIDEKIVKKCKELELNKVHPETANLARDEQKKPKTVVELMIESSSKSGDMLSEVYLREETFIVTFAGTDTTSVALSFTLSMLARHPDVQEKVYNEIMQALGDKSLVEAEDLLQLRYTEAVIKETLRLYPPAAVLLRKVDKNIVLPSGKFLVAGMGVAINVWAIHRNPIYWGKDAETFRPERFLESALSHPAAYLPFSYGVRNCIGSQYAMLSMKTSLSSLVRRYRVLTPANVDSGDQSSSGGSEPLQLEFDVMMRDAGNFTMRFVQRP